MAQNSCALSLPSFFIFLKLKWVARVIKNEMWAWSKQFKGLEEKQVPCENILFRHAAVMCLIIS